MSSREFGFFPYEMQILSLSVRQSVGRRASPWQVHRNTSPPLTSSPSAYARVATTSTASPSADSRWLLPAAAAARGPAGPPPPRAEEDAPLPRRDGSTLVAAAAAVRAHPTTPPAAALGAAGSAAVHSKERPIFAEFVLSLDE